jgi:hypothetical protein
VVGFVTMLCNNIPSPRDAISLVKWKRIVGLLTSWSGFLVLAHISFQIFLKAYGTAWASDSSNLVAVKWLRLLGLRVIEEPVKGMTFIFPDCVVLLVGMSVYVWMVRKLRELQTNLLLTSRGNIDSAAEVHISSAVLVQYVYSHSASYFVFTLPICLRAVFSY